MNIFFNSLRLFLGLSLITGLLYPLLVTFIAQTCFNFEANGSIIKVNDKVYGSKLIGQNFTEDKYLWGRPSATSGQPYNAASSSGSNLSPSNPELQKQIGERLLRFQSNSTDNLTVPIDLVTTSASGLDPHISLASAELQIQRIAKSRNLKHAQVENILEKSRTKRFLGILGEPYINVLEVNLRLDGII